MKLMDMKLTDHSNFRRA